jgi:hypothetical protein
MADDTKVVVRFRCPCGAMMERTLHYVRTCPISWCESCGKAVLHDDAAVQRAEELLRQDRHTPN